MTNSIVIDKCYLRTESAKAIHDLSQNHKLIVCESLAIEMYKMEPSERASHLRKLPKASPNCVYVPGVNRLILSEQKHNVPIGKPSKNTQNNDSSIFEKWKNPGLSLSAREQQALDSSILFHKEIANMLRDKLLNGIDPKSVKDTQLEYQELCAGKIRNRNLINQLINGREEGTKLPDTIVFNEEWITYRFYQVIQLLGIDLQSRYTNPLTFNSDTASEKMLHDVYDMGYLIIGLLEGGFATKEKKLQKWWIAINGNEHLYT